MAMHDIPSVQRVLQALTDYESTFGYDHLRACVRSTLAAAREQVRAGAAVPDVEQIVSNVIARLTAQQQPSLVAVLNGTGVIIQTNLGRAPLGHAARQALHTLATGYSNVEYNLETGQRGSRSVHLREQLQRLTGAEDALVVNNAAAALVLTLTALAQQREVLVSRGQAVEIGGGFRIPDVIRQSGCQLVEVGTTNRTYAKDYAAAITEQTAAFLRVHSSNFQVVGFVHEPSLSELVEIAEAHKMILIDDLGSGALLDATQWGLAAEPRIQDSVALGAHIVICSGDKLIGGPQAGIILGKQTLVRKLAAHPLMRALRVDKLIIGALSATLQAYEHNQALQAIPVWQMISMTADEVEQRAQALCKALNDQRVEVVATLSTVGGGSLPGSTLPSYALAWTVAQPDELARQLRMNTPALIGRISGGQLLVDLRTILPEQDSMLLAVLRAHT